jgi:hypothetical protein
MRVMGDRLLTLHIGASKTGTSSLQRGLFGSADQLASQGIGVPLESRHAHVERVLRPLGWVTASGFVDDYPSNALAPLVPTLRSCRGDRLLMTCEDLCEADHGRIEVLRDLAERAGLRLRVVLTLRGLATVVPSEWQQFLKHRMTLDYPTFLEKLREGQGPWARHFWLRQDAVEICRRWSDVVGAGELDVIVTPPRSRDPEGLYRLFGSVVGFDPAVMQWPEKDVNASWGYTEAELYRRVNAALGKRLKDYENVYQPAVRWPFVKGVLAKGASGRIPLPPEALPWVTERAEAQVAWLRDSGIRVHGELADLVPGPDAASPLPVIDEAEVAAAAVDTLANLAVHQRPRKRRR